MDLLTYFSRDKKQPVFGGEADVVDRLRGQERQAGAAEAARPGERYESVEAYDPVLRWHCRLDL